MLHKAGDRWSVQASSAHRRVTLESKQSRGLPPLLVLSLRLPLQLLSDRLPCRNRNLLVQCKAAAQQVERAEVTPITLRHGRATADADKWFGTPCTLGMSSAKFLHASQTNHLELTIQNTVQSIVQYHLSQTRVFHVPRFESIVSLCHAAQRAKHFSRLAKTAPLRTTVTYIDECRGTESCTMQLNAAQYSTLSSCTRHPWRVDRLRSEAM